MTIDLDKLKENTIKLSALIALYGKFYLGLMVFYIINQFVLIKTTSINIAPIIQIVFALFMLVMKVLMLTAILGVDKIMNKKSYLSYLVAIFLPFGECLISVKTRRIAEDYLWENNNSSQHQNNPN